MTSYTSPSDPRLSGLIIPVSPKNDSNGEQFTASQWLSSTNSYDPSKVEVPIEFAITKHEQHNEPTPSSILHKEEIKNDLVDIKGPVDSVEWHPSQDLMGIVFGGNDLKRPEFDIRLDDDLYIEANKQFEANIFPVTSLSVNWRLTILYRI
jgi:hypothetical protein